MMASGERWFLLLAAVAPLLRPSSGHGRLMEPPSRSSMWRQGFPSPINYADNQLFCGGFKHQWEEQGGRCGVCGDPYDGPRDHEPGGKYYTGITTRTFTRGQVIDIEVELTAFHYGYFEFRLCQLAYRNQTVGQDCFNRHLLRLVTPSESGFDSRYKLPSDSSIRLVKVKATLPKAVTCDQCVLQWKYHASNSWGADFVTGRGCVGCGPQEEFYGCADITVLSPNGKVKGAMNTVSSSRLKQGAKSAGKTEVLKSLINQSIKDMKDTGEGRGEDNQQDDWSGPWSGGNTANNYNEHQAESLGRWMSPEPKSLDQLKDIHASLVGKCQATGAWKGQAAMDDWCELNCEQGNCPRSHCVCKQTRAGKRHSAIGRAWTSFFPNPAGMQFKREPHQSDRGQSSHWLPVPKSRSRGRSNNKLTRQSYLQARPQTHGGAGFLGDAQSGSRHRWKDSRRSSKRGYQFDHPRSNSIPTEENMEQILAYSRKTFNSIRDKADAVYQSLMGEESLQPHSDFPGDYRQYRGGPDKAVGALYDPSLRLYVKRAGQNPYPWRPQGKSNALGYGNLARARFASQGSPRHYFTGQGPVAGASSSNYNAFSGRKSNDRNLIMKARFVDPSRSANANGHRNPQPKAAFRQGGMSQDGGRGGNCIASGAWTGQASMTKWCKDNCALGNCPATHCRCA